MYVNIKLLVYLSVNKLRNNRGSQTIPQFQSLNPHNKQQKKVADAFLFGK